MDFKDFVIESEKNALNRLRPVDRENIMDKLRIDSVDKAMDYSPKELFDAWLKFEGIIGYTDQIIDIWTKLSQK